MLGILRLKDLLVDVVCRSDRATLVDTYQYDDSPDDPFEREPYCVKFIFKKTGAPAPLIFLLNYFLRIALDF